MKYHSIVVNIGNAPPYGEPGKDAFFTWIGEFVKPIVETFQHDKYWFSYYGDHAKLRIWTDSDKYNSLKPTINGLLAHPLSQRLDDSGRPLEHELTLDEDLGSSRFRPSDMPPEAIHYRASKVLSVLHSLCDLVVHSLLKSDDGRWYLESNKNDNNPEGSAFESLHHLVCQITQVPTPVFAYEMPGKDGIGIETGFVISRSPERPIVVKKFLVHF